MGGLWSERFIWTEERVELLKTRWADGLSGALIAVELGVSRNATIGKLHRLGLGRARGAVSGRTLTTLPRGYRAHQRPHQARPRPFVLDKAKFWEDITSATPIDEIPATAVTLVQLEPQHCRWICTGDGVEPLYCGGEKLQGHSYCAGHCRRAYALSRPATRQHWVDTSSGRSNHGRRVA